MLDIKTWLQTVGRPVADTSFTPDEGHELPNICFIDKVKVEGQDDKNNLKRHSLSVEYYSETDEYNTALENLFNDKAIKYDRERVYLTDDNMFETIYEFEILERADT